MAKTKLTSRDKDYSQQSGMDEDLGDLYGDVVKGFADKNSRADANREYWDIYNCNLTEKQAYSGTSHAFIPVIHDAIEARVTRFTNTLFPTSGRHVDVVTNDQKIPHGTISLLENYVDTAKLRDITPALLRNGDVEGHYSIYIGWRETKRTITKRVKMPVTMGELELDDEYETVEDEEITDRTPEVLVVADSDICVLPATAPNPESAEIVAIALRMSKQEIKRRIKSGEFDKKVGETLIENFSTNANTQQPNPDKDKAEAAGVKFDGGTKHALIYMVWTKRVKLGKHTGWSVSYHAGENLCLSLKRNPNWNDRVPVLSVPLKRVGGSFWGVSPVSAIAETQYAANDALNMGLDSAQYALLPIVMTDPEKNPRTGSMILNMAAIWLTDPNTTKIVEFPPIWKEAFELVSALKSQCMQSLSVNPSMMPQGGGRKKPTQAEVSQEQAVAIEATADAVTILEDGIFTPLLRWFYEMDHQYREEKLLVRQFGSLGVSAILEEVEPSTMDTQYQFKWIGVEVTRSAQQVQQMIAFTNVLKGTPPDLLGGLTLNLAPLLEDAAEKVYGPRLAPKILIDERDKMTVAPEIEDMMLAAGHPVEVHPGDNDPQHMQAHFQAAQQAFAQGAPMEAFKTHIMKHQQALQKKAMQAQPPMQGLPGPGGPGGPREGAMPGVPRGVQQPPGVIHQDQLQDPGRVPR